MLDSVHRICLHRGIGVLHLILCRHAAEERETHWMWIVGGSLCVKGLATS